MNRLLSAIVIFIIILSIIPLININIAYSNNTNPLEIIITEDNITSSPYYKGGDGSKDNPWILEFGDLDLSGGHIYITNFTGGYMIIRNSNIYNGDWVVLNIGANDNVTNMNILIENTSIHDITDKGYALRLEAKNSIITLDNVQVYNGSSKDWWDATLCIEYMDNSKVYINNSVIYGGGHVIRIDGVDTATKIVVYNTVLYGVRDDVGWGTSWRGLIRIDNSKAPDLWIINSVFSAKDSAGEPSGISVSGINDVIIHFVNTTIKYENISFDNIIRIYEGSTIKLISVNGLTVENQAVARDIVHIGSNSGGKFETINITNVRGGGFRYLVGISKDTTGDQLLVTNINITGVKGIISTGNKLSIKRIIVENVAIKEVDKLFILPNTDNEIKFFEIRNLYAESYSDGADIRGVSSGLFINIKMIDNDRNNDGWADGNGLYLNNVNNTIIKNIYFEDAGWKDIVLDGIHYNITIENFVDKENVNSNGQNMLLAIGPWGKATVVGLTIRNGTVYSEDLLIVYDGDEILEDVVITDVNVIGSSPAGWESGRCGNQIYLVSGKDIIIENVNLSDATVNGIYLDNVDNVKIINVNISNAENYGVYITDKASNIVVKNTTFWHNKKTPQAYSDSSSVTAYYNLYTDYTGKDLNGDGIGDTPYKWAGKGGVVDEKPIYIGAYIAVLIITDENAASLAASGAGTPDNPYIINIDYESIPSKFMYGVYVCNLTKSNIVITGKIKGNAGIALLYIGENISTSIIVKDLEVEGSNGYGIIIDEYNGPKLEITSVTVKYVKADAISIVNSTGIVVDKVNLENIGSTGVSIIASHNIELTDVTVKSTGHWSIGIQSGSTSITIKGLKSSDAGWDGVFVEDSSDITIVDNIITTPGYKGIFIKNSESIRIENNKISYTHDSPILLENDENIIIRNNVIGPAISSNIWPGIQFKVKATNVLIEKNIIKDLQGADCAYGIAFWTSNGTYNVLINDVEITGVTMGIEIENGNNITMKNLYIHDLTQTQVWNGHGINIKRSNRINILDTRILNTPLAAIRLEATNNTNIKNVVIDKPRWGIIVTSKSFNVYILNVNITNTSSYGIMLWSGQNILVKDSIIMNSQRSGILIASEVSNVKILSNIIAKNGAEEEKPQRMYGLAIDHGATNIIVQYNSFVDNLHTPQAWVNSTDKSIIFSYNYWSDYKGEDKNGDGIGDTPYTLASPLSSPLQDPKPLMKPTPQHISILEKLGLYKPITTTTTTTTVTTTTTTTTTSPTHTTTTTTTTTIPPTTTTPTTTQPTGVSPTLIIGIIIVIVIIAIIGFMIYKKK